MSQRAQSILFSLEVNAKCLSHESKCEGENHLFKKFCRAINRVWGFSDTFLNKIVHCVFPPLFHLSDLWFICEQSSGVLWMACLCLLFFYYYWYSCFVPKLGLYLPRNRPGSS